MAHISEAFDYKIGDTAYGINAILGKIVKGSGLKLTEEGLLYEEKLQIENHQSKVGDILILHDACDLFEFLELDPDKYYNSCMTRDEIFSFISKTPYLKSSEFTNPNKTYKFPVFEEFRNFLNINNIENTGKNITLEYIASFVEFDFFKELLELKEKEKAKREAVEKFNGRTILDYYPNFDKSNIGKAIGMFKYSFGDVDTYRDFLMEHTIDEIMARFIEVIEPNPFKRQAMEEEISKEI